MKKKLVMILLVTGMVLSMAACGNSDANEVSVDSNLAQTGGGSQVVAEETKDEKEDKIPAEVEIAGSVYSTDATELYIYDVELSEKDIENMGCMKNLTTLSLVQTNELDNIDFVANMPNLKEFTLQYSSVSDISILADLAQLEKVFLMCNQTTDFTPLSNLTNLRSLTVRGAVLSDIDFVANLTNLTSLNVMSNQVTDISAVAGLSKLEYLDLGDNEELSDISALKDLQSLKQVDMLSTNISDLTPLYGLPNLTKVYIEGMVVSEEAIEEFKTMMPDCQREYFH